jgi:hypothetical protein
VVEVEVAGEEVVRAVAMYMEKVTVAAQERGAPAAVEELAVLVALAGLVAGCSISAFVAVQSSAAISPLTGLPRRRTQADIWGPQDPPVR